MPASATPTTACTNGPKRNDLLEAIREGISGRQRYTSDQAAEEDQLREAAQELRALLDQAGLDPDKATAAEGRGYEQASAARISGAGFGGPDEDVAALRTSAREWYRRTLKGTSVVNLASGLTVEFRDARKAFSASANPDKLRLFAALRDIVEKGTIERTAAPTKRAGNVRAYHWLTADVLIGDRGVRVGLTLREDNEGVLYYNHNPIDEASPPGLGGPAHKAGVGTEGGAYEQPIERRADDFNLLLLQSYGEGARGRITFTGGGRSVINLFESSDLSTILHEFGHLFLEELRFDALTEGAPQQLRDDWQAVQDWFAANGAPMGH